MQRDVVSIGDRTRVRDAARKLSAGGFHSLPVVDEHGGLVGIVTTTDLITCVLGVPSVAEAQGR
jgi:CBS domain-containing protein